MLKGHYSSFDKEVRDPVVKLAQSKTKLNVWCQSSCRAGWMMHRGNKARTRTLQQDGRKLPLNQMVVFEQAVPTELEDSFTSELCKNRRCFEKVDRFSCHIGACDSIQPIQE